MNSFLRYLLSNFRKISDILKQKLIISFQHNLDFSDFVQPGPHSIYNNLIFYFAKSYVYQPLIQRFFGPISFKSCLIQNFYKEQ